MGSVTGLVHSFAQEFDAVQVISSMMNGNRWPRPGYIKSTVSNDTLSTLKQWPAALIEALTTVNRDEELICRLLENDG